ncbi:tetratricopeptide repeat protein [Streptomyces lavendulae]|uniref:tetratricopeptide repeat protein n=1 Tax=Streptomyces lavendulae TaxID=1914 RepID=UPI002554112A|nr:tetratricopeptide repeat protein [Streptomyces lavendulae]
MSEFEKPVELQANASGQARVYQAGRDLYVHDSGSPIVPPVVIPLSGLGPGVSDFVGRNVEIDEVLARLASSSSGATVVLSGLGGIGKTALATRVARIAAERGIFPGGVVSIDLRGYDAEPASWVYPHQIYGPTLRALGVDEIDPAPENHGPQFHSELGRLAKANLPVLLLLDNVRDLDQVLTVIPSSGVHRVIVTSRNAIAPLLPGSDSLRLDVLPSDDAVDLIEVRSRRRLTQSDAKDLANICDRLPLALSIVGSILASDPDLSAGELTQELLDESERLAGLQHEDVAVRAAFQRSYARLTDLNARAFRFLSLNPGSDISVDSAALLLDVQSLAAKRVLRGLLNCHLIESGHASGRWVMHDLVRLYAAEQAERFDSSEARHAAQVRLLDYLARRSSCASEWINKQPITRPPEGFSSRAAAMDWFAAEASNLVAGVRVSVDLEEHGITADLTVSVVGYLTNVADYPSCLSVLFAGIEAGQKSGNQLSVAAAYNNLGIVYTSMRDFRESVRWLNKAVALFRAVGDRDEEVRSLINLSGSLRMLLGVEASMEPLNRAMQLSGESGGSAGFALTNLGISLRESGRFREAEAVLRKALDVHVRNGARNAEASTLTHLGTTLLQAFKQGQPTRHLEESMRYLSAAISAYRDVKDRSGEGMALVNYGNVVLLVSGAQKALEIYGTALQIFRDTKDHHGQGLATGAIGMALLTSGDGDSARPCLVEALQLLGSFHEPDKKKLLEGALESLG